MLTVAICTHDRAEALRTALASLAAQQGVSEGWELLVVANACTDGTPAVLQEFATLLPLRSIDEPRTGLSQARNRALAEARGDTLIFTDDDVELDRAWLGAYVRAESAFVDAEFFGGRVIARWDERPPRWFRQESLALLGGVFVHQDLGETNRWLEAGDPLPIGASFGLRRRLWERLGPFRSDLGVSGKQQGRGEETEFLTRAVAAGARGVYVGESRCWHPVDPSRVRFRALLEYGRASGVAHRKIRAAGARGSLSRALLHLVRGLGQIPKGRGDRFRQCVVNCGIELGLRDGATGGRPRQ